MSTSQNQKNSLIPFIDYVPAEVKELQTDNWRIVFYARKPGTDQMKRFRRRVKKISNKRERIRYAKTICSKINEKLIQGWSPFIDNDAHQEYTLFTTALSKYLSQNKQLLKDNQIRPATESSYASFAGMLQKWLYTNGKEKMLCTDFDRQLVTNYLDYIYFEKKRSATTTNNTYAWLNSMAIFMVDRGYLPINTISGIPKRKQEKKKREIIDPVTRKEIFSYFKEHNTQYLTLCLVVYYCFIRRTEMTKLRVQDVKLHEGIIVVPKEISKNKKTEAVTIPKMLGSYLVDHLQGANQSDYLFSGNGFLPGEVQLKPKKISDTWSRMRRILKIKITYQFYSLKDTGITELFLMNVPLIKIRDQARHHDIKITETYTPRNYTRDDTIAQIEFNF